MQTTEMIVSKTPLSAHTYRLNIGHSWKDRSKPYPVVCSYDPAINTELSDLKAYAGDCDEKGNILAYGHRDISSLVFIEGLKPTIYWVACLPTDKAITIQSHARTNPFGWMSFFDLGVVRVENLLGTNGVEYPVFEPIKSYEGPKGKVVSIGDDLGIFPASDVMEVADIVETRSFLHPKKEPRFHLLRTSKQLMDTSKTNV